MEIIRDKVKEFVVEGYVIKNGKILLMHHKKLDLWLPPGGHMEQNELPEESLKREIKEETGLEVSIDNTIKYPNEFNVKLIGLPNHIQVENIKNDHYHIDLVYICRVIGGELLKNEESKKLQFFSIDEIENLDKIPSEVKYFSRSFLKIDSAFTQKLPILNVLVQKNKIDFTETDLVIVQHIKNNTIEFIKLMKICGFKNIIIIGKSYSVDSNALSELKKFATVLIPPFDDLENLNAIERANALIKSTKFIGFDLGGYLSRYYQNPNVRTKPVCIIEDTKNGIWLNSKTNLSFPFLSVANSKLKNYAENHYVAKSIYRNSENLLINELEQSLSGKKIIVMGYGGIGEKLTNFLKTDSDVYVYDKDYTRLLKSKIDGFNTVEKLVDISDFDLIIGVTGEVILTAGHLLNLKNNAILINGSTRKKEFDIDSIKQHIIRTQQLNKTAKLQLDNGKNIYLINEGYPVNFLNSESVPEYILDIVFSEIFRLAQIAVETKIKPGFYPIEDSYPTEEIEIAKLWLGIYN